MKRLFSYIGYSIVHFLWYAMSLLPMRVLYMFSSVLYLLVGRVVKYRHKVIWKNLSNSFPEKSTEELQKIEQGFYRWFCDYFVETIKLMTMSDRELRERMTFVGQEAIEKCVEEGISCALYLGHYGNWELITSLPMWTSGKEQCCQVYHPLENAGFDALFKKVRERHGAACIPMKETLRRVIGYQQKGQTIVIGFIADQVPFWNSIHHWVDFLHQDTPVLTGSERIIKKMGQAVFYADVSRTSRGHYRCELKPMVKDSKNLPDWELTDRYFSALEATIRRQPELYLWSHNRWKRTRKEFNERFYVDESGKVLPKNKQ